MWPKILALAKTIFEAGSSKLLWTPAMGLRVRRPQQRNRNWQPFVARTRSYAWSAKSCEGHGLLCEAADVRFALVDAEKTKFPIRKLCRIFGVSESGFHAWKSWPESTRSKEDRVLSLHVKAEFESSRKTYGSPRIKKELDSKGMPAGKHRIARLMKEAGIQARKPRKFRVTTQSSHKLARAPNLVERRFGDFGSAPNRLWVTDLAYVWTQQGWLYLCVFLDVYSRKVVGFSIEDSMETKMVNAGLRMALRRRQKRMALSFTRIRGSSMRAGNSGILWVHLKSCKT
jgi:putative transposase